MSAAPTSTGTRRRGRPGWSARGAQWPDHLWINPTPETYWPHTQSIAMIREIFEDRMVPMTLDGLSRGMRLLTR
jgi:uncharacterized protein